jgi:hypothetical protein
MVETLASKDFQKIILEAIEEGLAYLGESPKQAIFFHLENTFNLRVSNIPQNLEEFKEALRKIFGPGALYLERLILERLCRKLNMKFEMENLDLVSVVESLKKSFPSQVHDSGEWGGSKDLAEQSQKSDEAGAKTCRLYWGGG